MDSTVPGLGSRRLSWAWGRGAGHRGGDRSSWTLHPVFTFFLLLSAFVEEAEARQAGEGQLGSVDGLEDRGWGVEGRMGSLLLRGELPRPAGTRPASVPGASGARGPSKTPFPWLTCQGCRSQGNSAGRQGSGGQEGG